MSLPVHEQSLCDSIEQRLTRCEPRLHRRLATMGTRQDRLRACPARWKQHALLPRTALLVSSAVFGSTAVICGFVTSAPDWITPVTAALSLTLLIRFFVLSAPGSGLSRSRRSHASR
ncbi:DUF3040 domain-containing protein [Streptomyces sp. NPDC059398]|uniref:DUF3040 domain-containing protein n=1 Tax=Streptomyces sp. NPDC059398 TaxID=3346820 RepID=UPI0036A34370